MTSVRPRVRRASLAALAALLPLAACSGGSDTPLYVVRTSQYTSALGGVLGQAGNWAVFLADENLSDKGSLNADTDSNDRIAVAVRLSDAAEFVTGVSPRSAVILGDNVYFVVDESLDVDWNMDTNLDVVLLRWAPGLAAPEFVAILDAAVGPGIVASGGKLWFVEDVAPSMGDETNLRYVVGSAPSTPVPVDAKTGTTGPVAVQLLGESNGLLVCALDENVDGDQNGDMDGTDPFVLALVESGAAVPTLVSTGYAMGGEDSPVLAHQTSIDAWRVLFLVSEAAQGNTSLDDEALFGAFPGWNPTQCVNGPDTDANDFVLHFLDWSAGDVVAASTVNTGLAGVATVGQNRLFATDDVVAVVAQESEFGAGAGCDFDGDTNFDDFVLRWVPVADLGAAGMPTTLMLPIDRNLPGGAMGALEYADRFVVASPRTFTIETVPVTGSFVHWLDPLTDNAWTSDLFDPDAGVSDPGVKVVVDQLSDETRTGRVPMGLREASVQQNLNRGCFAVDKDGIVGDGIGDITDTVASWLVYNAGNDRMLAAGLGWAVQSGNSGLVFGGDRAFFRVSEAEDGFDWNGDMDTGDQVLFRSIATSCGPVNMGTLNAIVGEPAVNTSGAGGAIYLVDEVAAGGDVNGSGNTIGFAVRHFRF